MAVENPCSSCGKECEPGDQFCSSDCASGAADAAMAAAMASMPPMPGAGFPAARLTDMHVCPMVTGVVPHVGGPILSPGCPQVLIQGMPAAQVGNVVTCAGPPDSIVKGSGTVTIGKMPAARMLDQTAHGGVIVLGCFTVLIGM